MPIRKSYGYYPDVPDARDKLYPVPPPSPPILKQVPSSVDLSPWMPEVLDQLDLGACVWHGVPEALRYDFRKSGKPDVMPSRLQGYYDTRVMYDEVGVDSGTTIRDALKVLRGSGTGPETDWPYVTSKFAEKPPKKLYEESVPQTDFEYLRVSVTSHSLRYVLRAGFPVIIGLALFETFETQKVASTGIVPMPDLNNEGMIGGHCMLCIGYGKMPGYFTVRNSWGDDWGDKGNCYMPYEYLGNRDYGSDYWVIKTK